MIYAIITIIIIYIVHDYGEGADKSPFNKKNVWHRETRHLFLSPKTSFTKWKNRLLGNTI